MTHTRTYTVEEMALRRLVDRRPVRVHLADASCTGTIEEIKYRHGDVMHERGVYVLVSLYGQDGTPSRYGMHVPCTNDAVDFAP